LADIHLLADRGDFFAGERFGALRQVMGAGRDFPGGVIRALLHAGEKIIETEIRNFGVFWHNWL